LSLFTNGPAALLPLPLGRSPSLPPRRLVHHSHSHSHSGPNPHLICPRTGTSRRPRLPFEPVAGRFAFAFATRAGLAMGDVEPFGSFFFFSFFFLLFFRLQFCFVLFCFRFIFLLVFSDRFPLRLLGSGHRPLGFSQTGHAPLSGTTYHMRAPGNAVPSLSPSPLPGSPAAPLRRETRFSS